MNVSLDAQPIPGGTRLTQGKVSEDFYLLLEFKVITSFFSFLVHVFNKCLDRRLEIESL